MDQEFAINPSGQPPLDTSDRFLTSIWMDNLPDEARAIWRNTAANSPQYTTAYLAAIDHVLINPPADLIDRMRQKGWIFLGHDDPEETPFSFQEHLDWLRKMKDDFQR